MVQKLLKGTSWLPGETRSRAKMPQTIGKIGKKETGQESGNLFSVIALKYQSLK